MNTMQITIPPQDMDDHPERQPAASLSVYTNEDLNGVPPTTFDGDRSQADSFITEFRIYCAIRGPEVEDWVAQQYDALLIKANDAPTPHSDGTNEALSLWEDFISDFKREFDESSSEVLNRLYNLRMIGDEVEMFIEGFNILMRRVERKGGSVPESMMVDYFRRGLPVDLELSIWERDTIPNTIDEWQSAARKEVEKQARLEIYFPTQRRRRRGRLADWYY